MEQPLAIQSWCFREFKPLGEFFRVLKAAGVAATELCGVHADFSKPEEAAGIAAQFKSAGVKLVAIGVETMTGEKSLDEPRFAWAKNAGVTHMSITFKPEAMFDGLRNVEALADQYDLQLGIHNHGGYDWLGNDVMLKYVLGRTSKRIGLHLDTAWAIDAKQNPVKSVEQFADRLVGVHVKDFVYTPARQPEDVIIGSGNLKLAEFMGALKKIGFAGPLVIEYEGDAKDPVPALSKCVKAMRAFL